jgi:hypothetical protein
MRTPSGYGDVVSEWAELEAREVAPPLDPELRAGLATVGGVFPPTVTPALIPFMRKSYASRPYAEIVGNRPIVRTDHVIQGWQSDPIELSVLRPESTKILRHCQTRSLLLLLVASGCGRARGSQFPFR